MRDEASYLESEAKVLSRESLLSDDRAKRALTRSIEIIGEAAKQVPDDISAATASVHVAYQGVSKPSNAAALLRRLSKHPKATPSDE